MDNIPISIPLSLLIGLSLSFEEASSTQEVAGINERKTPNLVQF